ncbi:MAG: hypothetical protein AYK19_00810 [Theionarchaea archaeon DG-70-1]|nr:MAG: hypothetical protein AYK19_00810 [Theionarchaea archaeon DG-70-1]
MLNRSSTASILHSNEPKGGDSIKKDPLENPNPDPEESGSKTLKDILSGIRSNYKLPSRDVIDLYIHVVDEDLSGKIYDIEILPEVQDPEWESADGLKSPQGWKFEKMGDGVRFYTETAPLLMCQGVWFTFKIGRKGPLQDIRLHVTDKNHENLGIVVSKRK